MRDILSKVMAGSMIAGAALLVAACSGGGNEANNTAADNLSTDVYNEMPADLNATTDLNGLGNTSTDLSNASNAVDNAADAIDNAQSNAQ